MNTSAHTPSTVMTIRVHLTDGSVESFVQADEVKAQEIWQGVEPGRLFAQPRLVIAGTHSKSVFVSAAIIRIDFIKQGYTCWAFPEGYADVVELSEADFRNHAHLDQPELMPKREQPTLAGDLLVSFLRLSFTGNPPVFLMTQFSVKLPAENQSFMRFLLREEQPLIRPHIG